MNRKVDVDGTSQGIVYGYHEGKEGEAEFFEKSIRWIHGQ